MRRAITTFADRQIGPVPAEQKAMLDALALPSLDALMAAVLPADIVRPASSWTHIPAASEAEALASLRELMRKNTIVKSLIGQGYYESLLPSVIQRNVLENPAWYTPYTPYQAEISQGRLEALMLFQTMVAQITQMDIANASLLDEATAAAEAMTLCMRKSPNRRTVFVADSCFRSTIDMIRTRAAPLGISVVVGDVSTIDVKRPDLGGLIVQTPDATGVLHDFTKLFEDAAAAGVVSCCGTDLLACTMVRSPGAMGADVVFGSAQRFGIPLGYGGPHPAFFAVRTPLMRQIPGRVIGMSKDAHGADALRMALQTREQHIRRATATSNICTAQALLANMAAFYAVYHGGEGLRAIAQTIHHGAQALAIGLQSIGVERIHRDAFFDTLTVRVRDGSGLDFQRRCLDRGVNVFHDPVGDTVTIAVDEATTKEHIGAVLSAAGMTPNMDGLWEVPQNDVIPVGLRREDELLPQPVFHTHHTEQRMTRYIQNLARKDYGLTHGMIPLGSCTMKLNPATTMLPLSWPEVSNIHPLAPLRQVEGYQTVFIELERWLCNVTGLAAVSLQPNSGAQGEYAGLRVIRAFQQSSQEVQRHVCLIPQSAHGTNPASAVLAGMAVETVRCRPNGAIDTDHLRKLLEAHDGKVSTMMLTYPSTYGVFDVDVKKITDMIHSAGAQVYMDGANLNAMVGYTGPAFIGADVCHINLHKTFGIPHGGGGPGMGPIAVAEHLAPYLPNTALGPRVGGSLSFGQVSQAAYGSASVLIISYMLMKMLGTDGMRKVTAIAILNANYLRAALQSDYKVLFTSAEGYCAHEFIIDMNPFKPLGVEVVDVAKRLMDYGLHAPTVSFPVAGTLMVEPTESESKEELDRLIDALRSIRQEIRDIETGQTPIATSPLKRAPHTELDVTATEWPFPYSRERAAFPSAFVKKHKLWPSVGRIQEAYGDTNFCSCLPVPPPRD